MTNEVKLEEHLTEMEIRDADDTEEFIRTKLAPVIKEMLIHKIVGYSDGDYWYEIVKKREEE